MSDIMNDKEWFLDFVPEVILMYFGDQDFDKLRDKAQKCAEHIASTFFATEEDRKKNAQEVLSMVEDDNFVEKFKSEIGVDPLLNREPYLSALKRRAGVE